MELWAAAKEKKLSVSVAVPPAPIRVPSERPLARVSRQSRRWIIYKSDNEMILGTGHRSPAICLTVEQNLPSK